MNDDLYGTEDRAVHDKLKQSITTATGLSQKHNMVYFLDLHGHSLQCREDKVKWRQIIDWRGGEIIMIIAKPSHASLIYTL